MQLERTVLSWSRTSFAALALAAASFKGALTHSDAAAYVTGGLAVAASAVLYGCGRLRASRWASIGAPSTMRVVAAVCLAAQVAGAVTVGVRLF
jgi:hypothetical protein